MRRWSYAMVVGLAGLIGVGLSAAVAEDIVVSPGDDIRAESLKLGPGDRMLLREGVYCAMGSTIRPKVGGESWEKPITIMSYPGERAVLDGTFVLGGQWERVEGDIYALDLAAAGHEQPRNVTFRHPTKGYPVSPIYMEILWQDGAPGGGRTLVHQLALDKESGAAIYPEERLARMLELYGEEMGSVDKPGEFYYSPIEHRLYVWLHDSDDPNDHVIRAPFGARTSLIAVGDSPYYIIRDLTLRGSAGSAIYTNHVDHFRLEQCEISCMGGQLSLGSDCSIRNSHIHHGFYNVAQGTGEGFVFEGNEVDHMGARDTWGYGVIGGETYGLNLSSGHGHVVRHNYFHDNTIGSNGHGGGAIVQETWGRKEGEAQHERTHHSLFANNVFQNCGYGLLISGRDTTHHHVIRHNVFSGFTRSAIRISGDNQQHLIVQNVFAGSRDAAIRLHGGGLSRYLADPETYYPTGNTIRGNVLVDDEIGFDHGAEREDNTVAGNTMLPAGEYALEKLMEMATGMGADFSPVPVVGAGR